METIIGWIILCLLIYIGIDYGCLLHKNIRLKQQINKNDHIPTKNIMITADQNGYYILKLASLCMAAHKDNNIGVVRYEDKLNEKGTMLIKFENDDELLVYRYDIAKIVPLSKHNIKNYLIKLFLDYKLEAGAERTIIKQLGLLNYMINIGICDEKSGGK